MTDIRKMLSPEERAEYDDLLYQAGYDEVGKQRPAHEIKEKMHNLLTDAENAGRPWATYVLDDDARAGHLTRFKDWDRTRQVVSTRVGERVVKRSAVMSLRRKDAKTGRGIWVGTLYPDMTRDDLMELIKDGNSRIESERITIGMARRLISLLDKTGSTTVAEGLEANGMTLDEFLTSEEGAA